MVQIRVSPSYFFRMPKRKRGFKKVDGSGGIRTHASEETGALNQRLRPLGHATSHIGMGKKAALSYQMMKLCGPGPMGKL